MATISLLYSSSSLSLFPPSHAFKPNSHSMPAALLSRGRRSLSSLAAVAASRIDTATWSPAPLTMISPASGDGTLFHLAVDVGDLASSHTAAGQYVQVRLPGAEKPSFLSIASPPPPSSSQHTVFEFLVKKVAGSVAELLCGLKRGDLVELSGVMGNGFQVEKISPPKAVSRVLIFATGSGISPIRSLIESGFNANERSDVRLYYGARNLQRMAYQDRFNVWESTGVKIIPFLSQPQDKWTGEQGYIQAALSRTFEPFDPSATGAVLCGHKGMIEDVTSILVANGVSKEKILKNF